jgi:hypothetical protein
MDDAARSQFQEIGDQVDGLMEEVENSFDELADFQQGLATRVKVDAVGQRYREAIAALADEKDRLEMERRFGRKVVDLLRMATRLPAPPKGDKATARSTNEFWETREGKSSNKPVTIGNLPGQNSRTPRPKFSTGADCDAWCGPCGELRTHTIVAMANDMPAQVICGICKSKHKYRTEAARAKKVTGAPGLPQQSSSGGSVMVNNDRKLDEKNALQRELMAAANVRRFEQKERYKVNEIIEHPEHGRGKIENVLPRSLLVRFMGGLKRVVTV